MLQAKTIKFFKRAIRGFLKSGYLWENNGGNIGKKL